MTQRRTNFPRSRKKVLGRWSYLIRSYVNRQYIRGLGPMGQAPKQFFFCKITILYVFEYSVIALERFGNFG